MSHPIALGSATESVPFTLTREEWTFIHDALVSYEFVQSHLSPKVPSYLRQSVDERAAGDKLISLIEDAGMHTLELAPWLSE